MLVMKSALQKRPAANGGLSGGNPVAGQQAQDFEESDSRPSSSGTPNWPYRQPNGQGQQQIGLNGASQNEGQRAGDRRLPFELSAELLTEADLEGGKLLSVEEWEETDPEDGCKIQVVSFHILSADETEESTITRRRKLKVNCTQSLRRVEYANGREAKYEERTVLDGLGTLADEPGVARRMFALDGERHLSKGEAGPPGMDLLLRAPDSFLLLLREKKDALVQMFPELFSNLRTLPAIFELLPSTVMETVVNEDGSTTMRTKSSKAFSSRYTRQETYVNGVRKESTSKFRAFMEYAGPEGGFCIRLNDNADADLSEEEEANEPDEDGQEGGSDEGSRISRTGLSEITDSQSAQVVTGKQGQLCLVDPRAAKRYEKAWHAVNEIVESEARYVQKLGLLDKFREEVEQARLVDRRQMGLLFANIASLHQFHEQHLLPQLMDRHREWQGTRRISDVLRKQAPFLKMYSEYTNNYKVATQVFEECARKKRPFEEIVKRMQQLPECEHLSLVSHLICPVQRVMRYQLLLKEYQRHLSPSDADWVDTEAALALVLEAASHANEMMRKLDRYKNVLEVQEQLGNNISLVSPGRELLTRSRLMKYSASNGKVEERMLFVFNDLFLLASERSALIGGIGGKYKLRAIFTPKFTQICEGDNLELENSFYLRGADSAKGPQRCVELFCISQADKNALFDTVWAVIQEAHSNKENVPSTALRNGAEQQQRKSCARCDTDFGWYSRQFVCLRCGQRFCKRCFVQKPCRMCLYCSRTAEGVRSHSEGLSPHNQPQPAAVAQPRRNLLHVAANGADEGAVKASFVTFRGQSGKQLRRFFVLRRDFCLYSYKGDKDQCALAMLPLSGCDVGVHQADKFGITIRHMDRNYWLSCANESDHAEWLAALLLSANARLPGECTDNSGQAEHPPQLGKSATVGFALGRTLASGGQQRDESPHLLSPSPLASGGIGIIRRSASVGDERGQSTGGGVRQQRQEEEEESQLMRARELMEQQQPAGAEEESGDRKRDRDGERRAPPGTLSRF